MAGNTLTAKKLRPLARNAQAFSVADAKAHFSEVLAVVEKRRQPITILRRGRAIAQLIPIVGETTSLYGSMRGTITEVGDIVGPSGGEWSVEGE